MPAPHYDARRATAECADLFGSPIYRRGRPLWSRREVAASDEHSVTHIGDLQDAIASRHQSISPVRFSGSGRLELGAFSTCRKFKAGATAYESTTGSHLVGTREAHRRQIFADR